MGRGITCDIVGEPLRYLKRKHPTTHGPSPHTPPQTQRGRDRFPGHGLVALGGTQHSATRLADQAVMSTWSSTAARPASRRATGTRNGEQET